MGAAASKADQPWSTPLECLLANLRTLHISREIHSKRLTFLSSEAWPQYSLDNGPQWPPTGTFNLNILRDLDNYCQKMGKWSEVCGRPGFDPWVGKIRWRRKWQPIPVLLPRKSHGQTSLVGYSPWGRTELDTTERHSYMFTHILVGYLHLLLRAAIALIRVP